MVQKNDLKEYKPKILTNILKTVQTLIFIIKKYNLEIKDEELKVNLF